MGTFRNEVSSEKLLHAMQQKNLVYNYNFLYYSNKDESNTIVQYNHPDGWLFIQDNEEGVIGFDHASNSCLISTGSKINPFSFSQALHEFPRWESTLRKKKVTAKVYMNLSGSTDIEVRISLSDGIVEKTSSITSLGDVEMQVQIEVNANASQLILKIESSTANSIIHISKVYANIGEIALEHLPCMVKGIIGERKQYIGTENPPAEELSLCGLSNQIGINKTRLHSVLNNRFGTDNNQLSLLPDMRGYFSRAWDNSGAIDPDADNRTTLGDGNIQGDHVSTVEMDSFKSHQHQINYSTISILSCEKGSATGINTLQHSKTELEGDNETRPKNIAELYTIKWA